MAEDEQKTVTKNFVAIPWQNIIDTPTTLEGYGITDAVQAPVDAGGE